MIFCVLLVSLVGLVLRDVFAEERLEERAVVVLLDLVEERTEERAVVDLLVVVELLLELAFDWLICPSRDSIFCSISWLSFF